MTTFTFYIHDDRYNVPSLAIVDVGGEAEARALAADRLLKSTHHTAIDVCEEDALQFSVLADRR